MIGDAEKRLAQTALSRLEQGDMLLRFMAEHLHADPDTATIALALEGIGLILNQGIAEVATLAA